MSRHDRAMEYAQALGYVEGTLRFIKSWSEDGDVIRAVNDGLDRIKEMDAKLWPTTEVTGVSNFV